LAEYTENFNLKKPAQADRFSIADYNSNLDKLDAAIGNVRLVLVSSEEYDSSEHSADTVYYVTEQDGKVKQYLGDVEIGGSGGSAPVSVSFSTAPITAAVTDATLIPELSQI